ncbi:MAG TPA: GLPGLI family protein [Ferruginibacter sp.]|nr:GLPGLI family protein [Ferruginibacter sp.]HRO18469.1 GLPGLI family protein [Ferruginibacter sp.]HRQ20725.1 GLPGLI family protein [Ferruginibacter sp.]
MKNYLIITFLLISKFLYSQNIAATYAVVINDPAGLNLEYEGVYYFSKNKSASYLKPLYLEKFPEGYITKDGKNHALDMDSIQHYIVTNIDSGTIRINNRYINFYHTYDEGFMIWEILPDTKNIDGLSCQKAQWRRKKNDKVLGEIWFATEIPVSAGLFTLQGLPGLLVEVHFYNFCKANLLSYNTNVPIDENVFWPEVFNQKVFKNGGHWKRHENELPTDDRKPKKKKQSYIDILNQ